MMEVNFTFVKHRTSPLMQLGLAVGIGWAGMLICKLFHIAGTPEYFAAFIAIIFYSLLNTVVSIAHPSFFKYTVPSYYIFIALLAVLLLSARYLSGVSIWNLDIYRMMLFPIIIFYALASLLVRAVRYIYDAAEHDF
jgi:hypothetical protein